MSEITQQLLKLFSKIVRQCMPPVALESESDAATGSRRAAHTQVDAPGTQAAQHRERLGDFERAVVRQHHAPAADADSRGCRRDGADHYFRTGACEARR